MLSLNEIKPGKILKISEEPFVVIKTDHHKMGRGGAVLKTKMKNLINGSVLEKTFQGNDKADEADTTNKKSNFLYLDDNDAYFMDNENFEQFSISLEQIGTKAKFLKEGVDVNTLYFQDKPVAIDLPVKMQFTVKSAPPAVKGNSAGNVTKQVELETGATINAPIFIEEGETIVVNTDTEEYVERV